MKFTVHMVVKNEDAWIWFAINSVLDFADKIIIYDTGSTDHTAEIIKSLNSPKIVFEEKGEVDRKQLVKLRNEQIKKTTTPWFLIVDGDEIWRKDQLQKLIDQADKASKEVKALFNRTRNCVGDVFHYSSDSFGQYNIAGIKGHLNIRMIRNLPDLSIEGEYPLEAYTDKSGPIATQDDHLQFADSWYLHTTYLKRSSLDQSKTSGSLGKEKSWEKGLMMKKKDLPEALTDQYPKLIKNPLIKRDLNYEIMASLVAPLKKIKNFLR